MLDPWLADGMAGTPMSSLEIESYTYTVYANHMQICVYSLSSSYNGTKPLRKLWWKCLFSLVLSGILALFLMALVCAKFLYFV